MTLPNPRPGLVISYLYLWHREHRAGYDEGRKARPCVIVSHRYQPPDSALVRVVPVTHWRPDPDAAALELPGPIKQRLGLDDQPSWAIVDELNEFFWPGFDLQPIPAFRGRFDYGMLPPSVFNNLIDRILDVWKQGQGKRVPRS